MLQMRPWKMSLLLEGNNNSKFQLLLTLQSSVFLQIKSTAEEKVKIYQLIIFSFCNPHSCSPHPHPTLSPCEYHPPPPTL